MSEPVEPTSAEPLAVPRGVLLDIEGTTSSISFVYDQMFPFVRRELSRFLAAHWRRADVQQACARIASDAGYETLTDWSAARNGADGSCLIEEEVIRLMDEDVKATGLKSLQGLIWKAGFESGELVAHVYEDVPDCLRRWCQAGCDVRIYSSGSVQAQRLFFAHTIAGNLLSLFRKHYDTTIGLKREAASYASIADEYTVDTQQILFLSDVPAELDAAQKAGMQTCLVCRPGNASVSKDCQHRKIHRFTELV